MAEIRLFLRINATAATVFAALTTQDGLSGRATHEGVVPLFGDGGWRNAPAPEAYETNKGSDSRVGGSGDGMSMKTKHQFAYYCTILLPIGALIGAGAGAVAGFPVSLTVLGAGVGIACSWFLVRSMTPGESP